MSNLDKDSENTRIIGVANVSGITPHNRALYEAGKEILNQSISVGREFCQFMIGICTGGISVYLAILSFLLPEKYTLGIVKGLLDALPALFFLAASIIFAIGYFPVQTEFSLDIPQEIENARRVSIQHRKRSAVLGFVFFSIGVVAAIVIVILNLGLR
jgi:hypothetical protein